MEHLYGYVYGLVAAGILAIAIKKVPEWLGSAVGSALDRALEKGDPADDKLVLAMVEWAEAKLPASGQGRARYLAVAQMITARVPYIKAEKLADLIESAVDRMEAAADARKPKIEPMP